MAQELIAHRCSYVDGRWAESDETFDVDNPADESRVTTMQGARGADVDRAITAARRSFDDGVWSDLPPLERANVLHAFIDHIATLHDRLVASMIVEAGQPKIFAEMAQYAAGMAYARDTIDLYLSMKHEQTNPLPLDNMVRNGLTLSIRRHEPIGVVSSITPYNGAIIMAFQKLIPSLMAGNSNILRPSPLTPLSSLVFAAAAEAAGLPAGVLSVVIEEGAAGAAALTTHPAVDMVSFTGSTAVGRHILAQAAPTVKRVALELGGKSAQIYLEDAVDRAGRGAAAVVAMTAGQACVAATRMLVPEARKAEVVEAVAGVYSALRVGPPSDESANLGPVITAAQRERCERYVAAAEEHGAKVVVGGQRPAGLPQGYYFEPTVLDVPDNNNPAARDEIFGPVIAVLGYRDLDDAVAIANDSPYGLSSQIYSSDLAAAVAVGRRIRAGAVNINTGMFSAYAPSGGYKQSGLGRERGTDGIRAFQEVKHLAIGELR
jgi:acyl-CoA reductase-like NAD-dependent aldehyde dehydrogenase